MKTPKMLTINGRRFKFRWELCGSAYLADCQCPQGGDPEQAIRIRPGLQSPDCEDLLLSSLLHECLHAADWSKDEEWVEEVSVDIARILRRFGFHRAED